MPVTTRTQWLPRGQLPTNVKALVLLSVMLIVVELGSLIVVVLAGSEVNWEQSVVLFLGLSFYILTVVLSLRSAKWGYAMGIAMASFSMVIMVSQHLWYRGTQELWATVVTGQLTSQLAITPIVTALNLGLLYFCGRAFCEHSSEHEDDARIIVASLIVVLVSHAGLFFLSGPSTSLPYP